MKKTTIKSAAVKTTKVTGATLSLAWSVLVLYVVAKRVKDKADNLIKIASA